MGPLLLSGGAPPRYLCCMRIWALLCALLAAAPLRAAELILPADVERPALALSISPAALAPIAQAPAFFQADLAAPASLPEALPALPASAAPLDAASAFASPQAQAPTGVLLGADGRPVRSAAALTAAAKAANAGDGAALGRAFDSGVLDEPQDGVPIAPLFLARSADQNGERRLEAAVLGVAAQVARAQRTLQKSVALGQWRGPDTTLDDACCGDAAPKLAYLLRAQGLPAHVVEAELHYYVVVTLPEGSVVVDPTIRQFFGGRKAPAEVPRIFVGTARRLSLLFQAQAAAKTTSFDVTRIYFRDARLKDGKLAEIAAGVIAGIAEYAPLARLGDGRAALTH